MKKNVKIAFAGNPNCGKTTIFNCLTGAKQHVGNWPGVTVEYVEGVVQRNDTTYTVTDLPGFYSISSYSYEEVVSRDYLINEDIDVVVNIVDASVLGRNLFLTTQLMEIGIPMLLVFNMSDLARENDINIDYEKISQELNIPYILTEGSKSKNMDELLDKIDMICENKEKFIPRNISYSRELEEELLDALKVNHPIEPVIFNDPKDVFIKNKKGNYIRYRWYMVKAIEGDENITDVMRKKIHLYSDFDEKLKARRKHMEGVYGETLSEVLIADRYAFVGGVMQYVQHSEKSKATSTTEKIDNVILNKWLGIPIFLIIMYLTFSISFYVGEWCGWGIDYLLDQLSDFIGNKISNNFVRGLVVDGVIGGVGTIIEFIPTIGIMFALISILEDSGYMSRAAFISDRTMHAMGLHGKSFVSLLLGFGCNVPAIMACRTLESKADRVVTILLNPLISCSARLPIYLFFASIFFDNKWSGLVIMSFYVIGVVLAVVLGKIFRSKLFSQKESPFVMELPTYKAPTFKGTFIHSYERTKEFVVRAGSIITLVCIGIWLLGALPYGVEFASEKSLIGSIGHFIEPIFKPLGLNWMAGVAAIFGVGAKEIVVSTIQILCSNGDVAENVRNVFTPLTSYVFMLFCLIYCPCAATIVTMKRELGEWKYLIFGVVYPVVLAWVLCFLVYQIGNFVCIHF